MHRFPVALNAACTGVAAAAVLPVAMLYPGLASAMVDRSVPGTAAYVALDAALCFGPLLVPFLLLMGALGLRSAWTGDRDATKVNVAGVGAWAFAGGLAFAVACTP